MFATFDQLDQPLPPVARERSFIAWWILGGLGLGLLLSAVGLMQFQRSRQLRAIAQLDAAGVFIRSDSYIPRSVRDPAFDFVMRGTEPVVSVRLLQRLKTREEWYGLQSALLTLPYLRTIRLPHLRASEEEVRLLLQKRQIRALDVSGNSVSDELLPDMLRCSHLNWLVLDRTQITDAGVAQLSALPELEMVSLEETAITDESLKTLATLPNLQRLYVIHCKLSEAALDHFSTTRPEVQLYR